MGKALSKKDRTDSYNNLNSFINTYPSMDLVIHNDQLGTTILWNTPYSTVESFYGEEPIIELLIHWDKAENTEPDNIDYQLNELPNMPFTTKYNCFRLGGKSIQPLYVNTGGGYRYLFYICIFGHVDDDIHTNEVRKVYYEF